MSRPRPAVLAAVLVAGLATTLTAGLVAATGPSDAPARAASPVSTVDHDHDHAGGHEHGDEGLRSTSSLRREITRLTGLIKEQKRVLRRCASRSGRSERLCERRASRRLDALRAERTRVRRQVERAERASARPPGPTSGTPAAGSGYTLMWTRYPEARWRCTTALTYRVNLSGAPSHALRDTQAAFALVGRYTGYRYVYAGATTGRGASAETDVVVSWTTRQVGSGAGAIAVGGQSLTYGGRSRPTLSRGYVEVEAGARLSPGMGTEGRPGATLGRVLVHEIAHVMGLGHVNDPTQIMHGVIGGQTTAAGAGDRAGLARQGRAAACA